MSGIIAVPMFVNGHRLMIDEDEANCGIRVASFGVRVASFGVRVASFGVRVAGLWAERIGQSA
jgi:hypothetical protein